MNNNEPNITDNICIKNFYLVLIKLESYFKQKIKTGSTKIYYSISDTLYDIEINFVVFYKDKRFDFERNIPRSIITELNIDLDLYLTLIIDEVAERFNKNILSLINKETNHLPDDTRIVVCDKCL